MRLKEKTAIVTGAGSGIGRAIALLFASEGARVVIAELDPECGRRVEREVRDSGGEALFVPTDIANEMEVQAMVQTTVARFRAIHILVNNAAVVIFKNAVSLTEQEWDQCMGVDLKGAWLCCKHALPHMVEGSIVNIASTHPFRTSANYFPYATAKGGMLAMTVSLAVDFGPKGIRVNSICPGLIDTPLTSKLLESSRQSPEQYQKILSMHALRRVGMPTDVAQAALFLASDESAFITGTSLVIDGGRMAMSGNAIETAVG
jgi:3-oxoacyl-[acyl-carrier protein] reductase